MGILILISLLYLLITMARDRRMKQEMDYILDYISNIIEAQIHKAEELEKDIKRIIEKDNANTEDKHTYKKDK